MSESHTLKGPDQRNAEHELWLAMQAAYNIYRQASSELDVAGVQPSGAIPSAEESLRFETATSEQRSAFENYIEARMQYAEFRCDQNNVRTRSFGNSMMPSEGNSRRRYWDGFSISRPALVPVVVLLGVSVLSLSYIMLGWRLVCGASTEREIGATLNQARSDIQALGWKIDAMNVAQQFVLRAASPSAPTARVRLQRTSVTKTAKRKSTGNGRWLRAQTPLSGTQKLAGRQKKLIHPAPNLGGRSYWTFTLPVSRQFEVVGPVRLSLRSVDPRHKYFDLSIMANDFKIEHVNLREPVSMTVSDPSRRVELVATRIDKNQVQGYVSELKYRKSELTASKARQRPSGGS